MSPASTDRILQRLEREGTTGVRRVFAPPALVRGQRQNDHARTNLGLRRSAEYYYARRSDHHQSRLQRSLLEKICSPADHVFEWRNAPRNNIRCPVHVYRSEEVIQIADATSEDRCLPEVGRRHSGAPIMGRTTRYLPRRADHIGRFGALASSYAGCAIVRGTEQYVDPVRSPSDPETDPQRRRGRESGSRDSGVFDDPHLLSIGPCAHRLD